MPNFKFYIKVVLSWQCSYTALKEVDVDILNLGLKESSQNTKIRAWNLKTAKHNNKTNYSKQEKQKQENKWHDHVKAIDTKIIGHGIRANKHV